MGIEALTQNLRGIIVVPQTSEAWEDWVSAGRTRNHALQDPLLDWLELHGEAKGFIKDTDLPDYDPRTDFTKFIFDKGHRFEAAVTRHLETLISIATIASGPGDIRDLEKAEATFLAMISGEPVIYQGVLRDAESRTYGATDLLVRGDVLKTLFPDSITDAEASVAAPDLGGTWHYCVVEIKFTTLGLQAGGELGNSGSSWAYKLQMYVYNRALGRLQGYLPPVSYLMGRGWRQTRSGITSRGDSCMELLAPVSQDYSTSKAGSLADAVDVACDWIRKVRREGSAWEVFPEPSVDELRPNMGSTSDQPWHAAKQEIGSRLQDLTLLWQVGVSKRNEANTGGIFRWPDPAVSAASLGISGSRLAPVLDAILEVNRSDIGPQVRPASVNSTAEIWRPAPPLEFYVDFETVSDLNDDFSLIPRKGGRPLIFMIGCGHVENEEWRFSCFTSGDLSSGEEARIIDQWLDHMEEVRLRVAPESERPLCTHWSPAETSTFETAYNAAKERHPKKEWPSPHWFDFLKQVVKKEPVVVRGPMGFGLKAVARAMRQHGLIQTEWDNGPADGLGAMVGAWWCEDEARRLGCSLNDVSLMQEIASYNEVDCKVMMEIVKYLRAYH